MPIPQFTPASPKLRSAAFDHEDFIFEVKMDGFRALAYVGPNETHLVSRRGNTYRRFTELAAAIHLDLDCKAVLDGEIVCLGSDGRPQFHDLFRLHGRGQPVFYVFDLLWLDGQDLRSRPLIERKRLLRSIVPEQPSVLLFADHVLRNGSEFFRVVCERDLEGIVAKLKHGTYGEGWFKIRNPGYSQREGRRELFEKRLAARQ